MRVLRGGASLTALFLVALLAWCSSVRFVTQTPEGQHCPTAAVQTVAVPIRDCCGRLIAWSVRKPTLGEKSFLQCRCAERTTAQHEATLEGKAFYVDLLPVRAFTLAMPLALPMSVAPRAEAGPLLAVATPPALRPPCLA